MTFPRVATPVIAVLVLAVSVLVACSSSGGGSRPRYAADSTGKALTSAG